MIHIAKQIYRILNPKERLQFLYVLLAALILTSLEVVGIGAIVAFMGILARPTVVFENEWLNKVYEFLNFEDTHQFIVVCGFSLLLIYVLRSLFAAFTVWLQLRFVWGTLFSLSQRLLENYIYRPYDYFLTHNSSEIARNLLSEISQVVSGVVMPVTGLVIQSVLAFCILSLLFWNDALLASVVTVLFGGAYAWVYLGFRHKLSIIGAARVAANKLRFKALSEAMGGIKDLRISGREDYFIENFTTALRNFTKHVITKSLIAEIPRHLIELIAFGGIFGIILYMVGVRQTMQEIIPIATLYVLAAYRVLPAFQKISRALTSLRFNHKALDVISQDLATDTPPARTSHLEELRKQPMTYQDAIKVKNVSFRYPTAQRNAVEKLTLKIIKNTSVGFVGPTGAGKSTAVDIILGLLVPQLGYVKVDETQISECTAPAWQLHMGYVPQQMFLADDTVAHNIAFGVRPEEIDHDAVARAARVAHVDRFVTDELPNGFDTFVGERGVRLSGGQRQRIAIARALYHDPEVLILDEATSAVDGTTEAIIRQSIHELGGKKTLIIIAHRLNTVQDCDVIYVFEGGTIVASGSYDELMQDCETFREMASPSARYVLR